MIAFFILLLLVVGVCEWISMYDPLGKVFYSASTSVRSVNQRETFEIISTVENRSRRPLPFVRVTELLPPQAELLLPENTRYKIENGFDAARGQTRLVSSVYLFPRQKLTRSVSARLPRRGRYFLRGAELVGGDFLGFSEAEKVFPAYSEIVALPERADAAPELVPFGGFLGDISVMRFTMEDPVLTLGFREYTGWEPQKQIAWTHSLRAGKLMVKQYDHTLEMAVTVILNVESHAPDRFALVERCFSLTRTVCENLEEKRIKYGFITNAMTAGALGVWSSMAEGLGHAHLLAILEGLGRATYDVSEHFSRTLERAARMAEHGRSHILITPDLDEKSAAELAAFSERVGGELLTITAEGAREEEGMTV